MLPRRAKLIERSIRIVGGVCTLWVGFHFAMYPAEIQPYELFLSGALVLVPLGLASLYTALLDWADERWGRLEDALWEAAVPLDPDAPTVEWQVRG